MQQCETIGLEPLQLTVLVPDGIRGAALAADGREAHADGGLLANFREDLGLRVLGNVVRHLEVAERACNRNSS